MRLIPSIDLRGGLCVRLLRGDFDAETRYEMAPLELLERYRGFGASWLHIVDLDGARDGQLANRAAIAQLAQQRPVRLQVGGGVRSIEAIEDLLRAGVARVVIGSVAAEQPALVNDWLRHFGPERVCLAFDVRLDAGGAPLVQTRGWREATTLTLWDAVQRYLDAGLRHVLCTDIDRDGALLGPNLELYTQAQQRFASLEWQASGGVRDAADLEALAAIGVAAAISGKALLEQRIASADLGRWLSA
jgi:phosphoribosylformimino-5-aminoimidazole carboxamide ribotide isomerase